MNHRSRFILLLFFLIIVPLSSIGTEYQEVNNTERIVLSDSIVKAQLEIIDSLRANETNASNEIAENLLNDLLSNSISNTELKYEVIYAKWKFLQFLSRHNEAIEFISNLISEGYGKPELYLALAGEYRSNNEFSKALENLQEAILRFQKDENLIGVADAMNYLIGTYGEIGMFDEAKKYFNDNLKRCNRIDYPGGLVRAYRQYGEYLVFENPNLTFELLQMSKKIAASLNNDESCIISVYLIRYYINSANYSIAKSQIKDYFKNCSNTSRGRDSNVFSFMAHIYSLENNMDSTIYFNNKALEIRLLGGNKKMVASSYLNLAGNYLVKNEIETANTYLEKAKSAVFESGDSKMLLTYYRGKVRYFEYIQDHYSAFLYSQKELKLSKELTNIRHQAVLSKLNTSFEIQQQNVLLERELEKREANSRLLIYIFSTLILLFIGLYFIYLYKKKNYSYLRLVNKASNIEKKLSISDKERLKLQSIFEYSVTGILILDKNGFIQYANQKSKELLDQSDDSRFLRIPFVDFFENNNKTSVQKVLLNVFIEHQAEKGLKVQILNQKNFHWLDISFAPLFFEEEDDNILVTLIDVTQEIININREKEQKQELQTLINSVTESILFVQRNGKIKALNNTAASRLDSKPQELKGADYFDTLPKSLRNNRIEMFDKVVRSRKPLIELEMVGNYNNLVSMYPNINSDGEVDYISEFVQDIRERRIAEEQIDSLKQRVLRSQMNPHFIFNSLTSIQSFVIRNEATMASKYLNSFARLIRLILESSRHDFISLKSEIDILSYYLDIQKMRFSDNFTFTFEIDPELDLERIKIPPMLAQPFIENSIEHGIQHLEKMGELNINFVKDDTRLMIELRDNGIGRAASYKLNQENIFASKSLSTKIINDRLDALNKYAEDVISYNIIDLKDEFNQASGTQVIISIPINVF